MTWDYLSEETDFRFKPVLDYFEKNSIEGKHIVDLNCLEGRLHKFIDGHASYIGNDVVDRAKKDFDFRRITDVQMADEIDKCDILLVFGYAHSDHPLESQTLDQSILKIIDKCKPELLVLDCVDEYLDNLYSLIDKIKAETIITSEVRNPNPKASHEFASKRNVIVVEMK